MTPVLKKAVGWPLLAVMSLTGGVFIAFGEHDLQTLAFVACVYSCICLTLLLLSGRPIFSVLGTGLMVAAMRLVSVTAPRLIDFDWHTIDLHALGRELVHGRLLLGSDLPTLLLGLTGLVCGVAVCVLVFRRERTRNDLRPRALAAGIITLAGAILIYPQGTIGQTAHAPRHRASSFFTALNDIGALVDRDQQARQPQALMSKTAYDGVPDCTRSGPRPDLIVVLMESAVPPSVYPEIKNAAALDRAFQSNDGAVHALRVETFGGGTSISVAGLMTSLPTTEFGWMRLYLPAYLNRRVHHSLPKLLAACGYKTAMLSPLPDSSVSEKPFMRALGIEDYREVQTSAATAKNERGAVSLQAALDYVEHHHQTDKRPLFLFVIAAAQEHDQHRLASAKVAPGGPYGNGKRIDDDLRRLSLQQADFKSFLGRLESRTRSGAVVLDFGDHQPTSMRGLAEHHDGAGALGHWGSTAYKTYYRITPVNMGLAAALPNVPTLDIAYLAPTLLQAAGLPLDDVYRELIALRADCNGALFLCADHERVARHLKMLANGRLLELSASSSSRRNRPTIVTAAAKPASAGAH